MVAEVYARSLDKQDIRWRRSTNSVSRGIRNGVCVSLNSVACNFRHWISMPAPAITVQPLWRRYAVHPLSTRTRHFTSEAKMTGRNLTIALTCAVAGTYTPFAGELDSPLARGL